MKFRSYFALSKAVGIIPVFFLSVAANFAAADITIDPDGVSYDQLGKFSAQLNFSNLPPEIISDGGGDTANISVFENTTAVTTVDATDPENNSLLYGISGGADSGLFSIGNLDGELVFKVAPDFETPGSYAGTNTYVVIVRVGDGNLNDSQTITIDVQNVNESGGNTAPVADAQSVSVTEDIAKAITLTADDADSDPLTYSVVANPSNGTLTGTAPNLTYTPNAEFSGDDSFTFRAFDNVDYSNVETISITVSSVNDSPTATSQSLSTAEDTDTTITLSGTDIDGTIASYTVGTPSNGSLSGTAPNLTYTPNTNFNGSDSFTFTATDNGGATSVSATVAITVTSTNDEPSATSQSLSTAEDTDKTITLSGTDLDGTIASYSVGTPSNGSLSGTAPNLTYTPNANFNGSDSFTFTVTDNGGAMSASATVSITVTASNDAPTATAQSVSTTEDTDKAITLAGTDVDGTIASYSVGTPANGSLSGTTPNLTYTPNVNFNGTDSFTFTVTDNDGATSASATVSITVTASNDAPTATAQSVSTTVDTDKTIILAGTDVDGTIDGYTIGTPSNGSLTGTAPNLTYSPNANFNGTDSFTFTVTDNDGATSPSATVSIAVNAGNEAPTATAQSLNAVENIDKAITLAGTDVDGTIASYAVGSPSNGSLSGTAPNLMYTPDTDYIGDDSFTFTVTDDGGATSPLATVSISVLEDLDGDGDPDVTDPDDDGDGISDIDEGSDDSDGDGIPNDRDTDSDGDGIPDEDEDNIDNDGDGIPNFLDLDSDGDGIPDVTEGNGDTDDDGVPNYLDIDSDNDGLTDTVESDANGNDSDGDGIDDGFDVDQTGGIDANNDGIDDDANGPDSDEDGVADRLDLDSDDDGIPDVIEAFLRSQDTDGDDIDDVTDVDQTGGDDLDGDGIDDFFDVTYTGGIDADGDGVDDNLFPQSDRDNDVTPDYLDLDSDDDGISDTAESGLTGVDTDGDGIDDSYDVDITLGNDLNLDGIDDDVGVVDTDNDSVPDMHDLDTDNDSLFDTEEAGVTDADNNALTDDTNAPLVEEPRDTDGDGTADFRDIDSDNDGLEDIDTGTVSQLDADDDGRIDLTVDFDGDGIDDSHDLLPLVHGTGTVDLDDDDDGVADVTEGVDDFDGDSIADYLDRDSDNDGLSDAFETDRPMYLWTDSDNDGIDDSVDVNMTGGMDVDLDGVDDLFIQVDTDSDGSPDYLDTDSDNDNISDSEEQVLAGLIGVDSDIDGIDDAVDVDTTGGSDTNNDGIDDALLNRVDFDSDGLPNFRDLDSDGDGALDIDEGTGDLDGDGMPNYLDVDSDGDGVSDSNENGDFNGDGVNDMLQTSSIVETGLRGAGSLNWLIALTLITAIFIRRNKHFKVMTLALFSIFTLSAQANEPCDVGEAFGKAECWYLGGGIGISRLRPDPNDTSWRSTDDNDNTFKVFTGFPFSEHLFAEFNYEDLGSAKMGNLNPSITQELDIGYSALGANVGYFLKEQDAEWNAYAKAGISFLDTDTGEFVNQDFSTQITFGAGLQWRFAENWFARLDLTSYDEDARVVGITVAKYFAGSSSRKPMEKIVPVVPKVIPEPDPVEEINPDLDGDGVPNEQDNCPDTAPNAEVNEKGCPLMETITLNIQFDTAKAIIKPEFMQEINRVAEKIKQQGEVKVFVEGHTDWQGKQVDNQPLSEARANAVADALKQKTELADKFFSVYGYGELKPIADNNTAEGRYKNRRVVVVLSQK